MSIHIFGIRHHGPGSARSLLQALDKLEPDIILVEGPPDAADILPLLTDAEMKPPVAILLYVPEDLKKAVYYPFAIFSPEWQAINYGLKRSIAVRFMDLPQSHRLAIKVSEEELPTNEAEEKELTEEEVQQLTSIRHDPLSWLAQAAGYQDGERWWEHMIEHRRDSTDVFEAVLEAMTALRSSEIAEKSTTSQHIENCREAFMRQTIRAAQKEGFEKIAVVCGAWHAPALKDLGTTKAAKEDAALIKALPKVKISATWIPWTYGRLSYFSGYGAGISSPGWYQHLWATQNQSSTEVAIYWMTKVASLLRAEDLDVSPAHIIEAVRLAEALSALRERYLPGLEEMNEAIQTVFCFGSDLPLQLISRKLIIGEQLGQIPEKAPMVPLQQDLIREQKRLRLPAEAVEKDIDLDLRKEIDLNKSHLLHRLSLLGIKWGQTQESHNKKGTFHELWKLEWHPDFSIQIIEKGVWGNTIVDAANSYISDKASKADSLAELTELVSDTLLADLPNAVNKVLASLQEKAALATDVVHLMQALPPLANVVRYGNVRKTDLESVRHIIDELIPRICIGLPKACSSLDETAAENMYNQLVTVNQTISLLQIAEHTKFWRSTLKQLSDQRNLHGLIAGRCCRLLYESQEIDNEQVAIYMNLALSSANVPTQVAAWVEGFLKDSGLLLIHDLRLWEILDNWISSLKEDMFINILPLLRRTFSTFPTPERRQMGELAKKGSIVSKSSQSKTDLDQTRAETILPVLAQLLDLSF